MKASGAFLFAGGAALLVTTAAVAGPTVPNGSFEDVQIGYPYYSTNIADVPGWTHAGPVGDAYIWHLGYSDTGGTVYATGDGNQFVTIGGGYAAYGSASWSTTISGLTAGDSYVLHFKTSNETGGYQQTMDVQVDTGPTLSYAPPIGFSPNYWGGWTPEIYAFVATGGTANVTFSVNNITEDMGLDAVSVSSAVPEPATWSLLLAGFGAIGLAGYRRARKSTAAA